MSLVALYISENPNITFSKNGDSITFYTTEQVGTVDNPEVINNR